MSKIILPRQERYSSRPLLLGKLFLGDFKSGRPKVNTAHIENIAFANTVLASDIGTSREYGRIKNLLHKKGQPIPENDIWIDALAIDHGLTLISLDEHLKKIYGCDKFYETHRSHVYQILVRRLFLHKKSDICRSGC